jgi:hypothetical protein
MKTDHIKEILKEAMSHKPHLENELAGRDINSEVSDTHVKVHKDNVKKAQTIVKKLGLTHKVVSGLNEGFNDDDYYLVNKSTKKVVKALGKHSVPFMHDPKTHATLKHHVTSPDHDILKGMKARSAGYSH